MFFSKWHIFLLSFLFQCLLSSEDHPVAISDQSINHDSSAIVPLIGEYENINVSLLDIDALLGTSYFYGEWGIPLSSHLFHFNNKKGLCTFSCQANSQCIFMLRIYDGDYKDDFYLYVVYSYDVVYQQSRAYNESNSTLNYERTFINIYKSTETHLGPKNCETTTRVHFVNSSSNLPFKSKNPMKDADIFGVQFEITSHQSNCNFTLLTTVMTTKNEVFDSQIFFYLLLMASFAAVEGVACQTLYKSYKEKENRAKRVAQGTLALEIAFNFYLTFFQVFQLMNPISYYTLICVPYGILSFVIGPKLIWKVVVIHIKQVDPSQKAKAVISSYLWMLSTVIIPLLSISLEGDIMFYFAMISLLPQIAHNHRHCLKYRWNFWIICCLIFPKVFFVVYIRADPNNLFRFKANNILVSAFLLLLAIQCLLLLVQTRWPRFGNEPKPPFVFLKSSQAASKEDLCSVCLENLKVLPESLKRSLLEEAAKREKMVITPCQHIFHENCLKKWLKTKSDCPNCRQALPNFPLEEDDDDDI